MEVNVKDDGGKPAPKKKPGEGGGKPPSKGAPPGPGAQHNLHNPPIGVPKAGQGIDPHSAMLGGIPPELLAQMGPPPPPSPGAPMGPNGLPVGGDLSSSDPMYDQGMDGSSLFQALNMQLDPTQAGPPTSPQGGGSQPGLEQLLQLLALSQAGVGGPGGGMGAGRLNPSGVFNEPTHPGEASGLNPFGVIQ